MKKINFKFKTFSSLVRSDLFAYRDQMRRQHNEYKMNTLNLLAKLYQTMEELETVSTCFY